jgi:hypothetical protein
VSLVDVIADSLPDEMIGNSKCAETGFAEDLPTLAAVIA